MTDPSSQEDNVVDAIVETLCVAMPSIRVGLSGQRVYEEGTNPNDERQLEADTCADELLLKRPRSLNDVSEYASEERPDTVDIDEGVSVVLDPLDGPMNLRPNSVMGTLYSIYDEPPPTDGENLLAAGCILYDPVTTLVVGRDDAVSEYILEPGTKCPPREELTLPDDPTIFSFNGRVNRWLDDFETFARKTERTEGMKFRYGGPMTGDVNQILHYGGTLAYPAQTDASGGKLHQWFEGFSIGYITECTGRRSSGDGQSLLSGTPEDTHDCVPVCIGNDSLVGSPETRLD